MASRDRLRLLAIEDAKLRYEIEHLVGLQSV